MMRRTTGLFACIILCLVSTPSYAAKISCFNPADASGMTELEWRAAGFLPWDDLSSLSDEQLTSLYRGMSDKEVGLMSDEEFMGGGNGNSGPSVPPKSAPARAVRNIAHGVPAAVGGYAGAVNAFDPDAYLADTSCNGLLSGDIAKGDYEKVATFLDVRRPKMFALNSNGGDVDEALKIGRLFRKFLILTLVPTQPWYCSGEECVCASACALIWFGGIDRGGGVGLHRPRSTDPKFGKLSPADATTEYRRALGTIAVYLDEMEVPKPTSESMVATDFSDIHWVDSYLDGLIKPPSIAEWEEASCSTSEKHDRCVHLLLTSTRDYLFSSSHFKNLAVRWLWRSLLAAAVIAFLIWLIMRLPKLLPAITLRLQSLQVMTFAIWGIWVGLLKPALRDAAAAETTEPAAGKSLAEVAARPSFKAPKWLVEGLIVAAIWSVFEAALLLWAHWYGAPPTTPIFNLAPVIALVMTLIVRGIIWAALVKPLYVPAPRAPRKSFADKVEEFMADSPPR